MAEFYLDIELPDFALGGGPLGARFAALGIRDFHTAVRHVWQLPYGRNRSRGLPIEVLDEGRGTCSTKHALLAATAAECGAPVQLWFCIYEMREANTPSTRSATGSRSRPSRSTPTSPPIIVAT